jgi:hypothetical protein
MRNLFTISVLCFLLCVSSFAQESEKIDEFSNLACDEYLMRVDVALNQAHSNSSSILYVFIYEGKEFKYNDRKKRSELVFPAKGSAKAKIASMKEYLSARRFPAEKVQFVEAGFRENMTVEFWLVPSGVKAPEPISTFEMMKYRKGKARGFCIDCCGI